MTDLLYSLAFEIKRAQLDDSGVFSGFASTFGGVDAVKPIPRHEDLGDDDRNAWETDPNGTPQDPWRECNTLPMKDPGTGQEFVFTTGSRGGIVALGKLSSKFGRQRHKQAGRLPVIEIGADSYRHKAYGDVRYPTFDIVGWESEDALIAVETDDDSPADELSDSIPF